MCQIRQCGRARLVGINHDQSRAITAPRLIDHRPEMNVVAVNVRAPGQNQLSQAKILCRRTEFLSIDQIPGNAAGLRANQVRSNWLAPRR